MNRNFSVLGVVACAMLFVVGCGSSDSTNPNFQAPDQVFTKVSNAVESSMADAGSGLGRKSPRAFAVAADPKCSTHGEPLDDNGDNISETDPSYAGNFFYCLIKFNSGGEDSLLGAIALASGISCALKDKVTYNGQPQQVSMEITSDCFPDSFTEEASNSAPDLTTVTVTPSVFGSPLFGVSSDWDYSIELDVPNADPSLALDVKLLFKTTETLAAVAASTGVNGHENDAFAVFVDTASGILRYESKNQRYLEAATVDNSTGWNRHNRVLVTGSVDSDGTFTEVSDVQAVHSDLYKHEPSPDTDSGDLLTLKGNPTDGFFTYNLKMSNPAATTDFSGVISGCSGGLSCSGNSGIPVASTSDLDFMMIPDGANFTAGADWFAALSPLSFSSVTTADSQ